MSEYFRVKSFVLDDEVFLLGDILKKKGEYLHIESFFTKDGVVKVQGTKLLCDTDLLSMGLVISDEQKNVLYPNLNSELIFDLLKAYKSGKTIEKKKFEDNQLVLMTDGESSK